MNRFHTFMSGNDLKTTIGVVLVSLAIVFFSVRAGSLTPSSSPASTFYTLQEIFNPLASTSYDSSSITANGNGSLIQILKQINANIGSSTSNVEIAERGIFQDTAVASLSFDPSSFSITASGGTAVRISLDYTNGPASRSIAQTITGDRWTFVNTEAQGTASASYLLAGNTLQVGGFSSAAYSRFGTTTTTHSNYISTSDDVLISGNLEVRSSVSFAAGASISGKLYLPDLAGGPSSDTVCFDASILSSNPLVKCSSSIRYKNNVVPLAFNKANLFALNPVSFTWKQGGAVGVGLIAEDVQEQIPDLTFLDNDGQVGGVRYQLLTVYLLDLAKEQERRISTLEAKLSITGSASKDSFPDMNDVVINGDLAVAGRIFFNSDAGGTARIVSGMQDVSVVFDRPFAEPPILQATIVLGQTDAASIIFEQDVRFVIINRGAQGFTIHLNKPAPVDITFNWTALAVKNPKEFTSTPEASPKVTPEVTPQASPGDTPTPETTPDPTPEPS